MLDIPGEIPNGVRFWHKYHQSEEDLEEMQVLSREYVAQESRCKRLRSIIVRLYREVMEKQLDEQRSAADPFVLPPP